MNDKIEQALVERATKKGIALNTTLELTPLCNMNCEMCFIRLNKNEMLSQGRPRTVDEWKNIVDQMKEAGTFFVLLTGGEPLLYEGFKEIYLYLHQMGMVISINSNGTLIDEEMADFFMNYPPRQINITLYGVSNNTYNKICHYPSGFDKAIKGIKLLKERGIHIKLNGTIVPENNIEIKELHEISRGLDIPIEVETYIYPSHRERFIAFNQPSRLSSYNAGNAYMEDLRLKKIEDFENIIKVTLDDIKLFKKRPKNLPCEPMLCRGGRTSAWINWKGYMSPCIFMNDISVNVFENGFRQSWEIIKNKTQQIHLPLKCSNCELRPACTVCPAMCKLETGEFNEVPQYVCEYTKTIVELMKEECSRF